MNIDDFELLECTRYGVKLTAKGCATFSRLAPERCEGCNGVKSGGVADDANQVPAATFLQRVCSGHRRVRQLGCDAPGCDGLHWGKGYCKRHYQQLRRYGQVFTEEEMAARVAQRPQKMVAGQKLSAAKKKRGVA